MAIYHIPKHVRNRAEHAKIEELEKQVSRLSSHMEKMHQKIEEVEKKN